MLCIKYSNGIAQSNQIEKCKYNLCCDIKWMAINAKRESHDSRLYRSSLHILVNVWGDDEVR